MAIKDVEKKLGYCFTNISLLELALTHKSSNNSSNNERLEYLGDSILNGVISEYLFLKFPNEKEGKLTRMRSFLVKGETLTKKANELGLIKYIKLSKGTANLSENRKYSILEGSIESLIGAVFLDNGWDKAKLFIMEIFSKELSELGSDQEFRDSKTELQELLQSKKLKLPKYISKESHNGFDCEVVLNKNIYTATGNSKRQAEIAAAKKALIHLKSENA
jgi:ribonuclease-3|tara:strand:+ start:4290 stop:4949 length:660 start_codon:yes stop_codon:yes gene_type:complete